ncbi:hypothetical protein RhiJN_20807 [Ceratobasidium sp. AG-Ba]|nr:hypothetical protein RhiJN_20807 [Ceratobasidium sp. AG-Ba]
MGNERLPSPAHPSTMVQLSVAFTVLATLATCASAQIIPETVLLMHNSSGLFLTEEDPKVPSSMLVKSSTRNQKWAIGPGTLLLPTTFKSSKTGNSLSYGEVEFDSFVYAAAKGKDFVLDRMGNSQYCVIRLAENKEFCLGITTTELARLEECDANDKTQVWELQKAN